MRASSGIGTGKEGKEVKERDREMRDCDVDESGGEWESVEGG